MPLSAERKTAQPSLLEVQNEVATIMNLMDTSREFRVCGEHESPVGCGVPEEFLRNKASAIRMKTLLNSRDKNEILQRLARVSLTSQPRWGAMSAHQMICHLSDSFRASLGEKYTSPSTTLFKRTLFKWVALWGPFPWPHGIKTRPEMDQQIGGTSPVVFASDLDQLLVLFERFCDWNGEFAPHAMLGQMSRTERMRHAYLHMDHHLRQFGV
jgi:Protein of unknown function (DUF1569)